MTQESHCLAYTLSWKCVETELKETCVPQCSSQHCVQELGHGSKLDYMSIGRWIDKKVVVHTHNGIFSPVQSLSCVQLFVTYGLQHTRLPCPSPSSTVCSDSCPLSWWCHPIISSCHPFLLLPAIFPRIRVFSNELALPIWWPKYWSFSISPSNEYSRLISFRIDWFYLLSVQESSQTPQFKSTNSSMLSLLYGPTLTSVHD